MSEPKESEKLRMASHAINAMNPDRMLMHNASAGGTEEDLRPFVQLMYEQSAEIGAPAEIGRGLVDKNQA
jgi:hypothetical protein